MNAIMKRVPRLPSFEERCWRVDMIILLSRGVSISRACEALNISRATYYRHVDKDPIFEHQVKRARLSIEIDMLKVVMKANDWRASAWYLEKRNPREWGSVKDRLRLERCTCGAGERIDSAW